MKKINQNGFTHQLLIVGILVLVVGAACFVGYRTWKNKGIGAQAAGWTPIGSQTGTSGNANFTFIVYACIQKLPYSSSTGGQRIMIRVLNTSAYKITVKSQIQRYGGAASPVSLMHTQIINPRGSGSLGTWGNTFTLTTSTPSKDDKYIWTSITSIPADINRQFNTGYPLGRIVTC